MQSKTRLVVAVSLVLVAVAVFLFFNRGYGELSERGYSHAMSLISACNRKDLDRVQKIKSMVDADVQSSALGAVESRWLNAIISHANNGDWETSSREVRKLMNDQINRRVP